MKTRKIIHLDMDAFYASVEMRDDPKLKLLPIAVGGNPKGRGVIATANYKARKYGVRSAMPSWKAKQLCPDLVIVHPNFEKYKQESLALHEILHSFTDIVEPLALDEAFLDVSDSNSFGGSATLIAQEIRKQIFEKLQLTASAGVAPNKFLAKVASDWKKPNGLFVISPEDVEKFIKDLPIEKISGIGHVTGQRLHTLNIHTCGDLQLLDILQLKEHFGNRAWSLHELSHGIDNRPVIVERLRKSLSVESTFDNDLNSIEACLEQIPELFQRLMKRFGKICDQYEIKKPFVKIKFVDFTTTTVESVQYIQADLCSYKALIRNGWERKKQSVRLLGLGINLNTGKERQLTFF